MATDRVTKVLVAGGGVAGLEAVLALQALAPGRFDVELVTPQRHVTSPLALHRPAVPAGDRRPRRARRDRRASAVSG